MSCKANTPCGAASMPHSVADMLRGAANMPHGVVNTLKIFLSLSRGVRPQSDKNHFFLKPSLIQCLENSYIYFNCKMNICHDLHSSPKDGCVDAFAYRFRHSFFAKAGRRYYCI